MHAPCVLLHFFLYHCRLRTSRKLWNVTERHAAVSADCFSYTLGPDLLVVLTNRGSNLGNATKACSVVLPSSSQLLHKGLAAVQDVLDFTQVCVCVRVCVASVCV
jgi:hypothetical protein